jgi:hypothetical protein
VPEAYHNPAPRLSLATSSQIGLDLSAVPLDEVLGFRSEYGFEYRMYARDVQQFVLGLSLMDEADQHSALMDRRAEFRDRQGQLRRIGRAAFARQAISLALALQVPHGR